MGGSQTAYVDRPAPCRSRVLARAMRGAALALLTAFAACQALPPAARENAVPAPECRWYDGCSVATLHHRHVHIAHRHRVKAAWRRSAPAPKRRDVAAMLAGMQRARAERHAGPAPTSSAP